MSSIVLSIFLLSIGASFIQRTTGFGFGIFIMTMLPFLMPSYGEATTLSGLLAITTSAAIVWRLRSYVTWQRLWPILLTFVVVSTIAIFALTRIEDHILRRILGASLILISIYFMLFSQGIKLRGTIFSLIIVLACTASVTAATGSVLIWNQTTVRFSACSKSF